MVNSILIPTSEQVCELRKIFFDKLDSDGAPSTCVGGFHPKDISRVQKVDIWLQRFLEQNDLDMKKSLKQLWETCEWRYAFGTNDITESNINMDYVNVGDCFPRNHDIEGKLMLIYKSVLHVRGKREPKELMRIFIYWMERLQRSNNYEPITIFFDLANCGYKNLDMDYTINVVNILKSYYPNAVNYILIYEMPWVFAAGIKIIKSLLPPKAVSSMKFVDSKNITEYISNECMLTTWGGSDDYEFKFEPEKPNKQVHFANFSPPETPMSDQIGNNSFSEKTDVGMLQINPQDAILFTKAGNELVGMVEITNIIQSHVTYKIKTTSPEKFRVRPSTGILAPGANSVINVVLQQGHQMPVLTKDKFLVMCMELSSDASSTTSHDIAELWKNTSSNSSQVEQHRLKCWTPTSTHLPGDVAKNGSLFASSFEGDRQVSHFTSTVTQLVTTTNRLESQIKFNQTLQWVTLVVIILLSIAIVYILKMEIKNANGEYCTSIHRN